MNADYILYYQALELEPGADAAAVKKAYFRLVRQYTPEKDPERFKTIRQAYEALKEGPPTEEPSGFPEPDDPAAREAAARALEEIRRKNYKSALAVLEEILSDHPDDPWLLLRLAETQRRAGHPQKAAKTAQRLQELYPDREEGYFLAAGAAYDRGWYKKALPLYRKAYDLGTRGMEFLTDYASALEDNGMSEESVKISREILNTGKWNRDNIEYAARAWTGLAEHEIRTLEDAREFLRQYEDFYAGNRRFLRDPLEILAPVVALLASHPKFAADSAIYQKADGIAATVGERETEWKRLTDSIRADMLGRAIQQDKSVQSDWMEAAIAAFMEFFPDVSENGNPELCQFARLDAQLCLLKKPEALKKDIPYVRENYPLLYARYKEFLEEAESSEDTSALYERLKRQFFKIAYKYSGSVFLKRYPEEDQTRIRGIRIHDGSTPFIRAGNKIGRNDPCPCGSGKKFKKCCMGKGVYD